MWKNRFCLISWNYVMYARIPIYNREGIMNYSAERYGHQRENFICPLCGCMICRFSIEQHQMKSNCKKKPIWEGENLNNSIYYILYCWRKTWTYIWCCLQYVIIKLWHIAEIYMMILWPILNSKKGIQTHGVNNGIPSNIYPLIVYWYEGKRIICLNSIFYSNMVSKPT